MNVASSRSLVRRDREDQALPVRQTVHRLHEPLAERPLAPKHRAAVVLESPSQHLRHTKQTIASVGIEDKSHDGT